MSSSLMPTVTIVAFCAVAFMELTAWRARRVELQITAVAPSHGASQSNSRSGVVIMRAAR